MDVHEKLVKGHGRKEDVSFRKVTHPLTAHEVLRTVAKVLGAKVVDLTRRRRGTPDRAVAATMLCRYGGLSQREAAGVLGLGTGIAVGWQLRSLPERVQRDRKLRRCVGEVERVLRARREERLGK
jgi:hypothetical protein